MANCQTRSFMQIKKFLLKYIDYALESSKKGSVALSDLKIDLSWQQLNTHGQPSLLCVWWQVPLEWWRWITTKGRDIFMGASGNNTIRCMDSSLVWLTWIHNSQRCYGDDNFLGALFQCQWILSSECYEKLSGSLSSTPQKTCSDQFEFHSSKSIVGNNMVS